MSGSFTIEIELGNAAMSSALDVARALREYAEEVEAGNDPNEVRIRDENGNGVGHAEFLPTKEET